MKNEKIDYAAEQKEIESRRATLDSTTEQLGQSTPYDKVAFPIYFGLILGALGATAAYYFYCNLIAPWLNTPACK